MEYIFFVKKHTANKCCMYASYLQFDYLIDTFALEYIS